MAPKVVGKRASSRSYAGHADDSDIDNLVDIYPSLAGTRLDDCHTCHSGQLEDGRPGNACDRCHELMLHGTGRAATETLNPFGLEYLTAGRSREALGNVDDRDSDGDGFTNGEELIAGRYPGNSMSRPGQAVADLLTVTIERLRALPAHSQFMLLNTSKQPFDDYATYKGIPIEELFDELGIGLEGATGITAIAPDGCMKSLPIEYVERRFPRPLFYAGLDVETLGSGCGFVRYPEELPVGLADRAPIPGEQRLILGYERDGAPLDPCRLDVASGRTTGEGPLRIVLPQVGAGQPDRGSRVSPTDCADGFDHSEDADHNAGSMVRGVVAIRIDPMPAGVEEFDYVKAGWAYVDAGELILYGHGIR